MSVISNSKPKTQMELNNLRALELLLRLQEANSVISTSKYTPRRS